MPTISLPADMPARMKRLPLDSVGRPVPFFVQWIDGEPDFRIMDPDAMTAAIRDQLCWTCGTRLLRVPGSSAPRGTFVAGPMCLVNRTSAEPPSHSDCATWAAKACPFLSKPAKERRETNIPDEVIPMAGVPILRNPGVTALIGATRWSMWNPAREGLPGGDGLLFSIDRVDNVHWMAYGRSAGSRAVLNSIETGLPTLLDVAAEPGSPRMLARRLREALRWVQVDDLDDYPTIASTLAAL